jgi:hypothetical protein
MRKVTPHSLAYVVCQVSSKYHYAPSMSIQCVQQVRFALSNVSSWRTVDGDFDYEALKARNDEWVGARPDVGSTVLLWMRDIACPKGIATEIRFLYRRGESWIGLWPG